MRGPFRRLGPIVLHVGRRDSSVLPIGCGAPSALGRWGWHARHAFWRVYLVCRWEAPVRTGSAV